MNKKTVFEGAATALVTPMFANGSINYDGFGELIDSQIAAGIDALVVCGTTGEASTMTDDEHRECIRYAAARVNKRVPLIAGTGSNDTAYSAELSQIAEAAGADALLAVSPYYNKTSQRGLAAHFTAIADAVHTPVILYNIPGRTGINIEIDTFKTLAKHPNIVAVKESGGSVEYFERIIEACGDDLDVYSGDDPITVPTMAVGCKGVISVIANILPREIHEMCRLALDGNFKEAARLQLKYLPLMRDLLTLDVNPIPVKTAMNLLGRNAGPLRLPLVEPAADVIAKLKSVLNYVEK